jgi:hypothetical protein
MIVHVSLSTNQEFEFEQPVSVPGTTTVALFLATRVMLAETVHDPEQDVLGMTEKAAGYVPGENVGSAVPSKRT